MSDQGACFKAVLSFYRLFSLVFICVTLVSILFFSLGTPAPPEKPPRLTAQVAAALILVARQLS